ncbi:DUF2063 domain-containing protein, partial [bacterium]|nr:DUF2063 domain-containing protein [bacterium]
LELAYDEWVEAARYVADDDIFEDGGEAVDDEALAQEAPIVSPLAWSLQFEYPVHKIGPDYRPESPEPTFLVVYRDRQDEVGFLEINPLTARLIALCQAQEEQPVESGRALLARIAAEMRHPTPEVVVEGGLKTLAQLASLDIIPRTRQVSS